jgi:hypothetical protein
MKHQLHIIIYSIVRSHLTTRCHPSLAQASACASKERVPRDQHLTKLIPTSPPTAHSLPYLHPSPHPSIPSNVATLSASVFTVIGVPVKLYMLTGLVSMFYVIFEIGEKNISQDTTTHDLS